MQKHRILDSIWSTIAFSYLFACYKIYKSAVLWQLKSNIKVTSKLSMSVAKTKKMAQIFHNCKNIFHMGITNLILLHTKTVVNMRLHAILWGKCCKILLFSFVGNLMEDSMLQCMSKVPWPHITDQWHLCCRLPILKYCLAVGCMSM